VPALPVAHDAGCPAATLRACLLRKALADCRQRAAAASLLGVTTTDVLALQHLARAGTITPGALSDRLQLTSGGTTAVVQRLERHGLVTSGPHPDDGRSTLLRLSPAAEHRVARAYAPLVQEVDAIVDGLAPGERAVVEGFLARVAEVTEASADAILRHVRGERLRVEAVPHAGLWA
jgi:DNA-binding MarR family transcriptional regulator